MWNEEGTSEDENNVENLSAKLSPRKASWTDLFMMFLDILRKKKGPLLTVHLGFSSILGCFVSGTLSHFLGNGICWNIFHFFTSWFYTAYKIVEKVSPLIQG